MPSPATGRAAPRSRRAPRMPAASKSLWIADTRYPRFPPLKGDLSVDVAVVGAGITGLTAATLLKAAGKTVAVVEAQRVAEGVTGYTTAHLTEVVDASFGTLLSHFGEDGARLAVEATRAVATLSRRRCRDAFEARFTAERMATDYLDLYRRLLD